MALEKERLVGSTIAGRYQITQELGKGGMGVVFKAEDKKLKRPIALKFLAADLIRDPDIRERFIQEAQTASRMDHPNICTIHEISETEDGRTFIVMAYYDGESLKDRICREPLETGEALDIAVQVAEGLGKAHRNGIIHRDIKPANVMVTDDGVAKIVDFGLAKLSGQLGMTQAGTVMGTPAYMSPEQVKGEDVDARADIWALGALLYEMLTGEVAFKGEHEQAVVHSILNRKPKPASQLNKAVPPELDRIINKTLAKAPSRRYASADEILADLKNLKAGRSGVSENAEGGAEREKDSVAVLHFTNITGDPEIDWLSGGIAETMTVDLKKISVLNVVSREKVLQAMKALGDEVMTEENIIDLGHSLGVRWIVWGGYQISGRAIRITAHFTETETGNVAGSSRVDGLMDDIFALQDKIIAGLIETFDLKVSDTEIQKIEKPETIEVEAYEHYARGRQLLLQMGKEGIPKAVECFRKAIQADPDYALAYSGLGSMHMIKYIALTRKEDLAAGISSLQKAVERDPDIADAYLWLTYAYSREERFAEAVRSGKKALQLEPDNPLSHYFIGVAYTLQGAVEYDVKSFGRAIRHYKKNNELQPNYLPAYMNAAWIHLLRGQSDEAKKNLDKAVAIEESGKPGLVNFVGALTLMGNWHLRQGLFDEALDWYRRSLALLDKTDHVYREPFKALTHCGLGDIHFHHRRFDEAFNLYKHAQAIIAKSRDSLGIGYFLVKSLLGLAKAFHELGVIRESKRNFEQAGALFKERKDFDFSWIWEGCDAQAHYEFSSYSALLNRPEEAISHLKKAAACGWRDVPAIEKDEAFSPLLDRPEFAKCIDQLKAEEPLP